MSEDTLFAQIGHDKLREVIEAFYDRMFGDDMIGFLFAGKDRATLVQREWEFTARMLGAKMAYSGRSIPDAHRNSPIMGGHFDRRLQLLRNVLADFAVAPAVQEKWLEHTIAMRHMVTRDAAGICTDQTMPSSATAGPSSPSQLSPASPRLKILPSD